MNRLAKVVSFVAVVALAALVWAGAEDMQGKDAPNVKLKTPAGETFDLSESKAKVVVFDFWASWCGPCRHALPQVQKVADWAKREKKPVAIYAVNLREDKDKIATAWKELKLHLPVLMDTDLKVTEAYQVEAIPTTVIVSGGKVKWVHVGSGDTVERDLKAAIERLL